MNNYILILGFHKGDNYVTNLLDNNYKIIGVDASYKNLLEAIKNAEEFEKSNIHIRTLHKVIKILPDDKKIIGNTQHTAAYLGIDDVFAKDVGVKQRELGYQIGVFINNYLFQYLDNLLFIGL